MATQAWGLSKFARAHFVSPSTGFILVSAITYPFGFYSTFEEKRTMMCIMYSISRVRDILW